MDRRGFFRVALASAGGHRHAADRGHGGRRARAARRPEDRTGRSTGGTPDEQRPVAARGLHLPPHRRGRRARGRHRTTAGTSSPTGRPPSTTATAAGSTCATARSSAPTAPAGRAPSASTPTARSSTPTGCSRAPPPTAPAARRRGARGSRARSASTAGPGVGGRPDGRRRRARPVPRSAAGRHEAVAVDPDDEVLYLTEDDPGGKLYRFTPDAYPDLSAGGSRRRWSPPDGAVDAGPRSPTRPAPSAPTRDQVPDATTFPGNEGIWYHDRTIVFTSKGDNRVHAIDLDAQRYSRLLGRLVDRPAERGRQHHGRRRVRRRVRGRGRREHGGRPHHPRRRRRAVRPGGRARPRGQRDHRPAFSPDGTRLYFSSQRGPTPGTLTDIAGDRGVVGDSRNGGTTWEVTGSVPHRARCWRRRRPSTTLADAAAGSAADPEDDGDGSSAVLPLAGAAVALGAVGAGARWVRSRRTAAAPTAGTLRRPLPRRRPVLVGSHRLPGVRPRGRPRLQSL